MTSSTAASALSALTSQYGSADWQNWTQNRYFFYDYVRYPSAGTNEIQFCVQPVGGLDTYAQSVKTLEQTNLPEARAFGKVGFLLQNIRTHIRILPKVRQPAGINNNATAVVQYMSGLHNVLTDLIHQGTLVITIGQKEYFDIPQPFITCPPGFGPTIWQCPEVAGAAASGSWTIQNHQAKNIYNVTPAQLIEPGQTFSAKISFDNANSPAITNTVNATTPYVEIGLLFDGYILRPMQ